MERRVDGRPAAEENEVTMARWEVVVTVRVVIVTAAAPIDNAHLYSSGRRVARGGVDAVVCRTTGCGYPYVGAAKSIAAVVVWIAM